MPDIGVLICGHGTRNPAGTAQFVSLVDKIAGRFPHWPFQYGFLEFAEPSIAAGLAELRARGAARIIAAPGLLFSARHAQDDIPAILRAHPGFGADNHYAEPLGLDPKMLRAAADRIEQAEAAAGSHVPRNETLLMVVGRGTSDPDDSLDLHTLSQRLAAGMEFGRGETCFAGILAPQTADALDRAAELGYRRIVVMPYFLFTGALVDRVYAATDDAARRHPGLEFLNASYLNDHPLVVETFCERIIESLDGPRHAHDHVHDHDADACEDDWHNHAPEDGTARANPYSLAPRRHAAVR